jgi:hypothetical protein
LLLQGREVDPVARLVFAFGAAAVSVFGLAGSAEGVGGYSYGGAASRSAAGAVVATVTPYDLEHVRSGHVAAWVGVGGPGLGPGGIDEWIQVGVNGFAGSSTGTVYVEIKRGAYYRYAPLAVAVGRGERHRIAVLESSSRSGWWRASVDGVSASPPVFLPGSHGRWSAQIVAESWTQGSADCNAFAFGFADVAVRYTQARSLTSLVRPVMFAEDGIKFSRSGTDFTARRRCP